ncbi:hypothetical protein BJ878DRAFT_30459 [Calycina marina]|uniref:Uncharacterized protein n=1 Tax=Calycina marina TaxID=1763456 RepID=A0A9P7Z4I1_9HELO|nr:hypothetical protein BJ878DRAFT_30459 [Calycina marina]
MLIRLTATKNAAPIKALKFAGELKRNSYMGLEYIGGPDDTTSCYDSKQCDDDPLESIRLYIPVVISLCPTLEKLVLNVSEDPIAFTILQTARTLAPSSCWVVLSLLGF